MTAAIARARVLILGLDGATFDILDPLIQQGIMPNLAAFRQRGIYAELRSTEPYVTAPAWTSIATGKRPDTHGVYDWTGLVAGQYQRRVIDSRYRSDLTFWEILVNEGIPAGCINLPLTWPPGPPATFSVADLLTPSPAAAYTYPLNLKQELLALGYRIDLHKRDYYTRGFDPFMADLVEMTRARGRAIRHCLQRFPWSAAISVFVATDRLQHAFWEHLDFSATWTKEIRRCAEFFTILDDEIGRILDQVGPETHVYIVSDHGFGPHHQAFYINEWLAEKGYLHWRREPLLKRQLRRLGLRLSRKLESQLEILNAPSQARQAVQDLTLRLDESFVPGSPAIDWSRTTAFADTAHGIRINLVDREPLGTVSPIDYDRVREKLAIELEQVKHPRSGQPIHREVLPREVRYQGCRADLAPDLVYTFSDFATTWRVGSLEELTFGRRLPGSCLAVDLAWDSGTHRPEGILMAAGPDLRTGVRLASCDTWDIVPSMFYHLDYDIPPDVDGSVIQDAIRQDVWLYRPVRRGRKPARRPGRNFSQSSFRRDSGSPDSQDAAIVERLRALGYLA